MISKPTIYKTIYKLTNTGTCYMAAATAKVKLSLSSVMAPLVSFLGSDHLLIMQMHKRTSQLLPVYMAAAHRHMLSAN